MRTLIIPCAGQSTRYNTIRPKYFVNHPSGNLMCFESIKGLPLDSFDKIVLITLKKYIEQENVYHEITQNFKIFNNFELVILDKNTTSSAETITKAIEKLNIKGEIYLKDADDYFDVNEVNPNEVCVFSLNDTKNITPGNKSYVKKTDNNQILNIVEKKVISSDFCCGLYSFESAEDFVNTFKKIQMVGEVYISHVIYQMLLDGKQFYSNQVTNFIDWGTQEDWDKYTNERL
tara:strand:- start:2116 stop:2811 length:696 start_codon:yes stop_codon:yes gene_type:complete